MVSQVMGDKEILDDSIASQKLISSGYNTYADECVNENLRRDFLSILKEEHDIQNELFTESRNRGWYSVDAAEEAKLQKAYQKFKTI